MTGQCHSPWNPSHSLPICLLIFLIFSICVDLCPVVPFKCRNFDTLPNTVDVRFEIVDAVVVPLLVAPICTELRLLSSWSFDKSLFLRINSIGLEIRLASSSLPSPRTFKDSLRLTNFNKSRFTAVYNVVNSPQRGRRRLLLLDDTLRSALVDATTFGNAAALSV